MTDGEADPRWLLTLYVSGASPRSAEAIDTVRRICDEELTGRVELRIVDVSERPAPAISDDIVAVPTLVKRLAATVAKAGREPRRRRSGQGRPGPRGRSVVTRRPPARRGVGR